jgi:hypothetical protein
MYDLSPCKNFAQTMYLEDATIPVNACVETHQCQTELVPPCAFASLPIHHSWHESALCSSTTDCAAKERRTADDPCRFYFWRGWLLSVDD